MNSIFLAQSQSNQPEVIEQRIITSEEEVTSQPGQVTKPVPSFVYFMLALLLIGVAVWAIKRFRSNEIPSTLLTKQVKHPITPVKSKTKAPKLSRHDS